MYVTKQLAYLILQFSSFNVAGDNFGEEKAIGKPDQYWFQYHVLMNNECLLVNTQTFMC
jgi:hypothetical protein